MQPVAPSNPRLPLLYVVSQLRFVITSMVFGTSPALAWVNNTYMPTSAFIWDKAHSLYFGGDPHDPTFNADLSDYLNNTLIADARKRAFGILKFYVADERWLPELHERLPNVDIQEHSRVLYRLNPYTDFSLPYRLPPHMRLQLINAELLQNLKLPNIDKVMQEIEDCWVSPEYFVDQAFGYCIIHDTDGVISWCTAEYFSPGMCGIGIETLPQYQGQGLATITARAFGQQATRLGWQVNWDAWLKNTPSIRVAEKAGFQKINEYKVGLVVLT